MELTQIYECFCDRTRLRILNLLRQTPLCVCHFQEILQEPQVKISKHLSYLKQREMVEAERDGNWIIYSLPKKPLPQLEKNLRCLQDCTKTDAVFAADTRRLEAVQPSPRGRVRNVRRIITSPMRRSNRACCAPSVSS